MYLAVFDNEFAVDFLVSIVLDLALLVGLLLAVGPVHQQRQQPKILNITFNFHVYLFYIILSILEFVKK